jgi:hypothetical protein
VLGAGSVIAYGALTGGWYEHRVTGWRDALEMVDYQGGRSPAAT